MEFVNSSSNLEFSNSSMVDNNISSLIPNNTSTSSSFARFYPIIVAEMVLSIICLILTIFVYSVLPEFRNVHGKNLICLSTCLLTAYVFLILDLMLRSVMSSSACYIFALIIHLSFLASFFWTNVMAFDICRTMTILKPKSSDNTSNKFRHYSIYAWISTILTSLPAAIFDKTNWLPIVYRPRFGIKRCWLSDTTAFVIYFNIPVGILLFSNLVMFGLTSWSMMKIKKMTDKMHIKQQRKRFNLYLKLIIVVGVIWLTEFLPWATNIRQLYILAGILTSLHGTFLFVIFVCKKRIIRQIFERYNIACCSKILGSRKYSIANTSSVTVSSSNVA